MQRQSLQTRNSAKQNRISVWLFRALTLKTSVEVRCLYHLPNKHFLILKHMLEIGKFGQQQKEKKEGWVANKLRVRNGEGWIGENVFHTVHHS